MKKNPLEKYYLQRNWTVIEIVCVVVILVAAVVATVVNGGIPIGVPIMVVAVVVLIFSKASKVKDTELDDELNKLVSQHIRLEEHENVIACYDLKKAPVVKGKDGRLRSAVYVISIFDFGKEGTDITVHTFDVAVVGVTVDTYWIPKERETVLREERITVPGGQKTVQYLVCDGIFSGIPVTTNDMQNARMVEKICG